MSDLIKITDSARARIQKLMTSSDDKSVIGIQIGVKNAGCSGMSYTMDYAKEIKPHDEVLEINDIKIIIDSTAVMFLVGTHKFPAHQFVIVAQSSYFEKLFDPDSPFEKPKKKSDSR